jgi:pimeloyl-ACP methyl ester carboxylesterase
LIAQLPAHINPILVSYPPDRHLTYDQLLPLVLVMLPPTEPFILFGESFSGPLALMVASYRPKNLLGVILCATFVSRPIPFIGWVVPLLARSIFFRLFPPAQKFKAILGRYSNPELQLLFAQTHACVRPDVIAFRVRMVFRVDVREALASCDVALLYISAANDRVVPIHNLRLIQQIKPNIQVVTIASPHGIPQVRPAEAADAIARFAASLQT